MQSARGADANEGYASESLSVVGLVPVSLTGVTSDMYISVDRLVPHLKEYLPERAILLGCTFNGRADSEKDVTRAFAIAAQVERYLREHHKLQVELWLSVIPQLTLQESASTLTFSVLPHSYRDFDQMQADVSGP